jgi:hypothetical protein
MDIVRRFVTQVVPRDAHTGLQLARKYPRLAAATGVLGTLLYRESMRIDQLETGNDYVSIHVKQYDVKRALAHRLSRGRVPRHVDVCYQKKVMFVKKQATHTGRTMRPLVMNGMRVWVSVCSTVMEKCDIIDNNVHCVLRIPVQDFCQKKLEAYFTQLVDEYHDDYSHMSNYFNDIDVCRWQRTGEDDAWAWAPERPVARRTEDTLFGKVHREVLDDVKVFMKDQSFYEDYGISHKRTYVLHGPAGTGKTTLIRLVASIYDKSIHYLDLSNDMTDDELIRSQVRVPKDAMIVIEDINKDSAQRFNESTLLNLFDGLSSNENLIFITTNHIDAFREFMPDAFFRPGRVNMVAHINFADSDEVQKYTHRFFTNSMRDQVPPTLDDTCQAFGTLATTHDVTIALVQKHCVEHRTDPATALQACTTALDLKR